MEQIKITAELQGPIVINRNTFFTLDALLAAVVFDQAGSVEQAHNDLPLKRVDGLWYASAAIWDVVQDSKRTITQCIKPDSTWMPYLLKNKKGGLQRKFDQYNIMNTYREVHAKSVTWYATGDADKVQALLQSLPFIGKKRATPARWTVEPGELDGVMGYLDDPLRPVPLDLWTGDKDAIKGDATWMPAYWSPENMATCALPN